MKYLSCIVIFILCLSPVKASFTANSDSLLRIIQTTKDLNTKKQTYQNLADLYFEKPEEVTYLKLTYSTAIHSGDKEMALNTLLDLSYSFIKSNKLDSAIYYMNMIETEAGPEKANAHLSYLRMKTFMKEIGLGKEEMNAAIKQKLDFFEKADKKDLYIQIEQAYITGSSLYENRKFKESTPYLETAYKLAQTLAYKDGYKYVSLIGWSYANIFKYTGNQAKTLELLEDLLQQTKNYYSEYYTKQRPFYPTYLFYLQYYTSILMHMDIMSKEKTNYYIDEINKIAPLLTEPFDKYNYFLALSNHSAYTKDYRNALIANDSLIKYGKILAPTYVPGLIRVESELYENMKDYKRALDSHKRYVATKDSMASNLVEEQLNKLQVQYDVDKLTYEKTRLENKNKQILLIALGVILLLTFSGCAYLYYNLKRERRMKKRLHQLNEKAEESEKLKTAFLNSMCHEIRTPLNAIVGFSGIIVDESIDSECKQEFYNEITTNTNLLTSLIDHLLVVANLDSSEEQLPCESTDIKCICQQEMEKAQREGKETISYQLEMPEEELFACSNHRYLTLVIENLLNNANKFTEKGNITLGISLNKDIRKMQISVTDTGCGIPIDKQEIVFERFTKLDSFTQGNGLGLYLCKLIIKRLSGNILIDSNYTKGTRFIINLPV